MVIGADLELNGKLEPIQICIGALRKLGMEALLPNVYIYKKHKTS